MSVRASKVVVCWALGMMALVGCDDGDDGDGPASDGAPDMAVGRLDAAPDGGRLDAGLLDAGDADAERPADGSPTDATDPPDLDAPPDAAGDAGPACEPVDETCNGLDDDCDGQVDEGALEAACYSGPEGTEGVGACVGGHRRCEAGVFGPCLDEVIPQGEICDGVDNDCDGRVDDLRGCDCMPPAEQACYSGPEGTAGVGRCSEGLSACGDDNRFGACVGQVVPAAERCNAVDDDCDGVVDEAIEGVGAQCRGTVDGCAAVGAAVCDPEAERLVCGGLRALDRDGDRVPDCEDGCPEDRAKTAPGVCGCGVPEDDSDGDRTPDCRDPCADDPTKVQPGQCGCGVPEDDADADGVPDCVDRAVRVRSDGQIWRGTVGGRPFHLRQRARLDWIGQIDGAPFAVRATGGAARLGIVAGAPLSAHAGPLRRVGTFGAEGITLQADSRTIWRGVAGMTAVRLQTLDGGLSWTGDATPAALILVLITP